MNIYIMRHGEAGMQAPSDAQRALTQKGMLQSEQVGIWLSNQNITIERAWVSPYLRAQQTYENLEKHLSQKPDCQTIDSITPSGNATLVTNKLLALAKESVNSVLVVSHLPLVGYLVNELCPEEDAIMFATADIACIELDDNLIGTLRWHGSLMVQE